VEGVAVFKKFIGSGKLIGSEKLSDTPSPPLNFHHHNSAVFAAPATPLG
jgi:hypothetical protein